eukprot:scaffold86327_cov17-Tisochrysis_lutea.AAC.1
MHIHSQAWTTGASPATRARLDDRGLACLARAISDSRKHALGAARPSSLECLRLGPPRQPNYRSGRSSRSGGDDVQQVYCVSGSTAVDLQGMVEALMPELQVWRSASAPSGCQFRGNGGGTDTRAALAMKTLGGRCWHSMLRLSFP